MRSALVVGGAGYIGSHMVARLASAGFDVTTFDDLSGGHRDAVRFGRFVHGSVLSRENLRDLFQSKRFDVVLHFAGAPACVPASVADPRHYYGTNLRGTLNLLDAMLDSGCSRLVFSSSCSVYGNPTEVPIRESALLRPVSPYGTTKLACERAISDYAAAYGICAMALRYFNVAGAAHGLRERHEPETHLVPLALREAARVLDGGAPEETGLTVCGDGAAVRDYVHVEDVCDAHALAAEYLLDKSPPAFGVLNLGAGRGSSVLEVLDAVRAVTGAPIRNRWAPPRVGDPPTLIAAPTRAAEVLGWTARYPDLRDAIASAWQAIRVGA